MSTVDKTWVFATDNEGLADVGDSNLTLAHDTAGNPGGSFEIIGAASGTAERYRRATTGQTWETWGVPAGSTVTDVQVISWDSRRWNNAVTTTITMRVVDSTGTTVHSAGDLQSVALASATDVAWVAKGAGTSRAVDAGKQASTTDVRLEIGVNLSGANINLDIGIDNILLRMTYAAGGGGTTVKTLAALGVG